MPCYTKIEVWIEDDALNRRARKKLGLATTGPLSTADAARVKREAGILKAQAELPVIQPGSMVVRRGNKLTVTVTV